MKRKNIIFLGLTLLVIFSFSLTILAKEQVFDFRQTNWGMSREQVRATEKEIIEWEDWGVNYYIDFNGHIVNTTTKTLEYFPVEINGKSYTCQYVFLKDNLYRGRYRSFGNNISEYGIFKELLNKKYGEAKTDREIWFNTLFKGDSYYLENAIKSGHLIYVATWETLTTNIELKLSTDGGTRIMMTIHYWSKELMEQKIQGEEKERIDKLKEEENKTNL